MRPVTQAEAVVAGSLLATTAESVRAKIRASGLPSRTFEAAAHRILTAGWVYDRFLPNPTRFGLPTVTFGLCHPFAEATTGVRERWAVEPGNVVLWEGPGWLFGVFFEPPLFGPDRRARRDARSDQCSRTFFLTADSREPNVPIYFDFEGSWAARLGRPPPPAYPRPLPGAGQTLGGGPYDLNLSRDRVLARGLVGRPIRGEDGGPLRRSHVFLARAERKALARGIVEHRVLLDVCRLPEADSPEAGGVVLLHGRLASSRPEELLAALRVRCGVAPFLFAADDDSVLVGSVFRPLDRTAVGPPRERPLDPILATLQRFLHEIEIVRGRSESLTVVADHRYDRLLPPIERPRRG